LLGGWPFPEVEGWLDEIFVFGGGVVIGEHGDEIVDIEGVFIG
jgi:hypothetical protein